MSRYRSLLLIVVALGAAAALWRWQQRRFSPVAPTGGNKPTPPSPPPWGQAIQTNAPPPSRQATTTPTDSATTMETAKGPRRIPTRVHRGAPPPPPPTEVARPLEQTETAGEAQAEQPAEELLERAVGESSALQDAAANTSTPSDTSSPAPTEEAGEAAAAPAPEAATSGLININTASEDALIALPGIGPALARRIIEYREKNGPFPTVDDLINVPGIGPNSLTEFAHLLTVSD